MPEDLNQKISLFLDNELDQDEALSILKKMQSHSELKNKMNRYETISHALKTDVFLYPSNDFSNKINQQIQQEPFYLLPKGHLSSEHKPSRRSSKMLAVAASIAAMAIITAHGVNISGNRLKTSSALHLAQQQPFEPPSSQVSYPRRHEQNTVNARIYDYLQAHSGSVYTNGEANFGPFARVSAYSQE